MWKLDVKWYELLIRAIVIYFFLFPVFRLWGKKHLAQLAPFDFLILLIMSEAVQNGLMGEEYSLTGSLISIITLFLIIFLNKLSFWFPKAERIIEGKTKVIIHKGILDKDVMNSETITDRELHEALRMQGISKIEDVELGTLETNGAISVIKKKVK